MKGFSFTSILITLCFIRCRKTGDLVQIRITVLLDSSPTPSKNNRGSRQEPIAMGSILMLEIKAAQVSKSALRFKTVITLQITHNNSNIVHCM